MFGKKTSENPGMGIYVVYDSKSGTYQMPRFSMNDQVFIREVTNFVQHQASLKFEERDTLYTNAEDFIFFRIGSYSKETGKIETIEPHSVIALHEIKTAVSVNDMRQAMKAQAQQQANAQGH